MTDAQFESPAPAEPAGGTVATIRGSILSFAIRLILSVLMGVVISRALEPAGRGEYSVIVVIATIATVLGHLSIGQASVSYWASHRAAIPANTLLIGPPLGALAAVIVGLVVIIGGQTVFPVPNRSLLLLGLLTVPTAVMIIHLTMVTLLLGRIDVTNRSLTIAAVIQLAGLLTFEWAGHLTAATVVWLWAICGVLPLFLMWPTIRPHVGKRDLPLARRMIAAGAQYHVGLIALYLLLRIDVLILNALAPMAAVGLYTLAVSVGEMAYGGTESISQTLLRRLAESQMAAAGDLTVRTVRVAFVVAIVSLGGICLLAPIVILTLYGEAFRGSVAALYALAPGLVVYSATRALTPYLLRLERPRSMSVLAVAALVVNVALNLWLIPRFGIVGCALASTAGYAFFGIGQAIWFGRAAGTPVTALLPRWSDVALITNVALEPFRRRAGGATNADR